MMQVGKKTDKKTMGNIKSSQSEDVEALPAPPDTYKISDLYSPYYLSTGLTTFVRIHKDVVLGKGQVCCKKIIMLVLEYSV